MLLVNNTNRLATLQLFKVAIAIKLIIPSNEYGRVYKEYNKNSLRVKVHAIRTSNMQEHKRLLDAVLRKLGFIFISTLVPRHGYGLGGAWSLKLSIVGVK